VIRYSKHGGMRFIRIGRIAITLCWVRKRKPIPKGWQTIET